MSVSKTDELTRLHELIELCKSGYSVFGKLKLDGWVQQGMSNHRYIPGPLSAKKHFDVDALVRWCLWELAT